MKQYLIFYHYIYIKCSSNQTLLYNLLDGKYIVVNDPVLVSCISKVHEKSYYGFEVTDEISKLQSFVPFVHEVENLMFGEIFKDLENRLPLVFHPVVDVKGFSLEDRKINSVKNGMRSVKYFRNRMGSEIVENLFDITIYVTSSSKISEYKFAYKQYHFPFYSKSLQIVNLDWLEKELRFSYPNLKSINVILGDIDERYLSELLDLILKFSLYNNSKVYLYLLAEQFYQYKKDLLQMSNIQYVLWIRNISEMQEHSSFKNVVYSVLAKNRVEYQGYRRFFKHSKVPIVIYPYFDKGKGLYMNYYDDKDHCDIFKAISTIDNQKWVVTYDRSNFIRNLYKGYRMFKYNLNYSAATVGKGTEYIIFSDNCRVPRDTSLNLLRVKKGEI